MAVPAAHSPTNIFRLVVQQVEDETVTTEVFGKTTYRGEWLHLYTK